MKAFALLIFSLFLSLSCSNLISIGSKSHAFEEEIIEVKGISALSVKPDTISISFQVTTLRDSASAALSENNEILNKAIFSLKDSNLTENEIGTSGFSLGPSYKYINYHNGTSQNVFEGYKVQTTLEIKTKKLENAGALIDSVIKAGVSQVNSINFEISKELEKEIKDKLLVEAVTDAKQKAELALSALKAKIKGVLQVDLDKSPEVFPIYRNKAVPAAMAFDAVAENTSVYVKSQDVKVEVYVIFSISQGAEIESLFP